MKALVWRGGDPAGAGRRPGEFRRMTSGQNSTVMVLLRAGPGPELPREAPLAASHGGRSADQPTSGRTVHMKEDPS